tara:strand:- start:432 stop:1187 length:756 start_codon:yes stop_codon:yes gene_type:complete
MPIDFSKFKTNDTITQEILANSDLVNFINVQIDSDNSDLSSQLDSVTTAKALADEKLEKTAADLAALKESAPDDAEAVKALKEQMASMRGDIEGQFREQIKTLGLSLETEQANSGGLQEKLDTAEVTEYLRGQISEYNAKHPAVAVVDGGDEHLVRAGLAVYRKTENGIRALSGKTELYGLDGKNLQGSEYFSKLRNEPSTGLFFNKPTGGGANGGNGGGAGDKTMARSLWEKLEPHDQSKATQSHQIIDG